MDTSVEKSGSGTPRRKHPFLASFFKAVLRFKQMANKTRKWKAMFLKTTVKHYKPKPGERSEFSKEITNSQKSVDYAKAGAPVIVLEPEKLQEYTLALSEKKLKLRTEKIKVLKQIHNRRRFGKTTIFKYHDNLVKTSTNFSKSKGNAVKQLLSRLNSMTVSTKNFNLTAEEQQRVADSYIQKSQKIAADFDYKKGTAIVFGSEICLQARHGGYLSYAQPDNIRASAPKPLTTTKFKLHNCQDSLANGLVEYGQSILLAASQSDILGANFGSGHEVNSKTRKIEPKLIKMHDTDSSSMLKAHQYGRWIILNKDDPIGTKGQPVNHMDNIILEQGWNFLGSSGPSNSFCQTVGNFDEVISGKREVFRPSDDCTWRIVLMGLPSGSDKDQEIKRLKTEMNAYTQLKNNQTFKAIMRKTLSSRLKTTLPPRFHLETVMQRDLAHKIDKESNQLHLVDKYNMLHEKGFRSDQMSHFTLRQIYGSNSNIYQLAEKRYHLQELQLGNKIISTEELFADKGSEQQKIEKEYWDVAGPLLIPSECYADLYSSMDKYFEKDMVKKVAAAKVIQKYFQRKLKTRFSWARYMPDQDSVEISKLKEKDAARRKILQEQADRLGLTVESMEANSEKHLRKAAEEDKIRRAADLKSSKVSASGKLPKPGEKMDTVLFEGVDMPAAFFHSVSTDSLVDSEDGEGDGSDDCFEQKLLFMPSKKSSSPSGSGKGQESLGTSQVLESVKELGFRGYETPMRVKSPHLKRVLSAMPLSRHLYPVRKIADEKDSRLKPKSDILIERPSTAPNFTRNENFLVTEGNDEQSKSLEAASFKKKSEFRKTVSDNINKLAKTSNRKYGLPMDVLERQERPGGLSTGVKFLQAVAASSGGTKSLFSSLSVKPSAKKR